MEELGRRLRAAREAKGITLQVAEDDTKIRRKYLEALEAGREVDLPGDAYTKGFLRTYGNYLDLDGTQMVEEYKLSKLRVATPAGGQPTAGEPAPVAPHPQRQEVRPEPAEPSPVVRERPVPRERPAVPERPAAQERPSMRERTPARERTTARTRPVRTGGGMPRGLGTGLLAIVLLAAVGYLGVVIFRQGVPEDEKPIDTPPVVDVKPEPTPPPVLPEPPKVTMTRGTGPDVLFSVPAADITVVVEPNGERLWMQATLDGKKQPDQWPTAPVEFKGKQVVLRMGHMNNINLIVNGQRFDKPLQNGPYTLNFTAAPQS